MSSQNPKYSVYGNEYLLHMVGDRAETEPVHSEDEFVADGDSLDECRAAARSWAYEQGKARVFRDGESIGSIAYHSAMVYKNQYDEDGKLLYAASIDEASTLTEGMRERFERAKGSYYAYLDYLSDYYDEI